MPRSGSTLFEQVLAAHPQVEGASELPDLEYVLQGESARRGRPFPEWVPLADAGDWQRLGQDYLRRTARWRERRSEEHTSELQSLMRISYAVFCLKKKKRQLTS